MTTREFAAMMLSMLPFEPNSQQMAVGLALARFCAREEADAVSSDRVFVLNGYAGTGKTSLTGALVKALHRCHIDTVLMAPTGRAAKVFGTGAGFPASTIHRRIYRHALPGASGAPAPRENKLRDAVFIVDEASMIGSDNSGGNGLLDDLIHYVYSGPGCRLILLGDTAQLPPVGMTASPAMDSDVLRGYGLKVTRATMTEVARHDALGGILYNATRMRRACTLSQGGPVAVPMVARGFDDVRTVASDELPDLIDSLYSADGIEETVLITRSNRSATEFNAAIRAMVLGREELLTRGDLMIAAKNNYHWTRKVKGIDFVANGEMLRLAAVHSTEVRYGLHFADVTFAVPGAEEVEFDAKIILTCLTGSSAALDPDSRRRLYEGIYNDPSLMAPDTPHPTRMRLLRESPYWNAIEVKYAYAVTCHKAQGGQWSNVLVDVGYIPSDSLGPEFYRWLYTAITRARSKLYIINPPEDMVCL